MDGEKRTQDSRDITSVVSDAEMAIKLHALVSGTQLAERQDRLIVMNMTMIEKITQVDGAQEDTMTTAFIIQYILCGSKNIALFHE